MKFLIVAIEKKDQAHRDNYTDLLNFAPDLDPTIEHFMESNNFFKGTRISIHDLIYSDASIIKQQMRKEICEVDIVSLQINHAVRNISPFLFATLSRGSVLSVSLDFSL